jgi:hypothetical protein
MYWQRRIVYPLGFCSDLWYGVMATSWGGNTSTFAAASFDYISTYFTGSIVAPNDVNGEVDACIPLGTVITPINLTVASGTRSVTLQGLSQNIPYSVSVAAILVDGTQVLNTEFVPHAYARPMPPRAYALGAWYSARNFRTGISPVAATSNRIDTWPDNAGNGHVMYASGDRRPIIISSQSRMMAVQFRRANAHWMQGGADSIDLGISTEFMLYTHALLTNSAPSVFAGRGMQKSLSDAGWAHLEYADFWNPWPGSRGIRIADGAGQLSSGGQVNIARWSYIYQGVTAIAASNLVQQPAASSSQLYPFATKSINMYRPAELSNAPMTIDFVGFPGSPSTNFTTFGSPVAVNWSTGVAWPPISNDLNFHVGGPNDPAGDTYRSLDGQVFDMATYREAHNVSNLREVQEFFDWYSYRRCYGIMTPNVVGSAACSSGYRDDQCYQSCGSGYAQTSGTNDHCMSSYVHGRSALVQH